MGNTMKAAVFEAIKTIKVKEVPIPEIGEDDVLIKVKNTGICGTDWSIYNGWYSADKLPMIAGHEFSGRHCQGWQERQRPQRRRPGHCRYQHVLRSLLLLHPA